MDIEDQSENEDKEKDELDKIKHILSRSEETLEFLIDDSNTLDKKADIFVGVFLVIAIIATSIVVLNFSELPLPIQSFFLILAAGLCWSALYLSKALTPKKYMPALSEEPIQWPMTKLEKTSLIDLLKNEFTVNQAYISQYKKVNEAKSDTIKRGITLAEVASVIGLIASLFYNMALFFIS